jgi:hypothetical protein
MNWTVFLMTTLPVRVHTISLHRVTICDDRADCAISPNLLGERASCDSRATAAAIRETPRNRSSNVTVFDLDLVILGWHPRSNRQHRVYVLIGKKANIMKMTTSSNQAWESYSAWSKYNAQLRQTPGAGSSNENAS